jgi:hypothetical protein
MAAKQKQAAPRGRKRFKSKFTSEEPLFDSFHQPRPYGEKWPVINIAKRRDLLKFYQPKIEKLPAYAHILASDVPWTFAQVTNLVLGQNQTTLHNAELARKLDLFQERNVRSHVWNQEELPPKMLHDALSQCAKFTISSYPVVQRALARLYAVAWFGHSSDSVEAKRQLEKLLPSGRANPITKWIPELAGIFREMRCWIQKSNDLMNQEFPREIDRVKKLAELYDEPTGVISAALRPAETPFLTERLHVALDIPEETVRKALSKLPAARV